MTGKPKQAPGHFRVDRADLPLGIERAIFFAASDSRFADDLIRRRAEAVYERGVFLRPSERALLEAIPEEQLRATIGAVDVSPPNVKRRTFLRAAALTSATATIANRGVLDGCEREASASPLRPFAVQHGGGRLDRRGSTGFYVEIEDRGLLQRLSVFVQVEADDPRSVEVSLVTPSGATFKLLDGERSRGVTGDGVRGWYGSDGNPTIDSLATLSDTPARGQWMLEVRSLGGGQLVRWRMGGQVSDESMSGAYSTYSQYGGAPSLPYNTRGGCDCQS